MILPRRFEIGAPKSYSLAASAGFLEEFAPAAYEGEGTDHLRLAFVADGFAQGGEKVAGAYVYPEGSDVVVEAFGEAEDRVVGEQVSRVLSLDVDGSDFPEVGVRDPVVGALQARYPGLRPVLFNSPYEAAAWAIIGNRVRITQAARVKARVAEELGPSVEVRGRVEHAFPGPSRLARLDGFRGLGARKVGYLRHLAGAAADGKLEADYLRSLPVGEALARLKELPGIGDFSAELVLLRGVGTRDVLPVHEHRLRRAVAMAYGLDAAPTLGELLRVAERWRPYRTWVSLQLRTMLEEETREVGSA